MRRSILMAFGAILIMLPTVAAQASSEVTIKSTYLSRDVLYSRSHGGEKFFAAKVDWTGQLRVVLAHDQVGGKLETVASMCQRYHCLVGINGDFFGGPVAVGGISISGHILRTPYSRHGQVMLHPEGVSLVGDPKDQRVVLISGKLHIALPMNIDPRLGMSSIYTSAYGGTLKAGTGKSIRIYHCSCSDRPDEYGKSYRFRLQRVVGDGSIYLARNDIAIIGRGAQAHVFETKANNSAFVQMPRFSESDAIGANPVIMTGSKISSRLVDSFSTSGHPRSVFASNAAGRTWLIAIDTRVTLAKAAQIAKNMGATEAINLDGGGSTTFVIRGKAVNNPADKAERAVASAILVVRTTTKKAHGISPQGMNSPKTYSHSILAVPNPKVLTKKSYPTPIVESQVIMVRYKVANKKNNHLSLILELFAILLPIFDLYLLWRLYRQRQY
jgi:hypothetical protein